ncbi:MAG: right-handed parallel beta-helix repeat-containing protein [Planctomycetes bacterium]|nr:right-handed parallel beta-helix repeat-containing protein [Planctomycetota bacterium]
MLEQDPLAQNVDRLIRRWADPLEDSRADALTERFLAGIQRAEGRGNRTRWEGRIAVAASLLVFAGILVVVQSASPSRETAMPAARQEEKASREHVVQPGDSVWKIAQQYYGDGRHWRLITVTNPTIDVAGLEVGQRLVIPPFQEPPVVRVATADELVNAIAPDTSIALAPGIYNLSKIKPKEMEYVAWEDTQITLRAISNLTIFGSPENPATILVDEPHHWVLNFVRSEGVTLANLVLGHVPSQDGCDVAVIRFEDCTDVRLDGCDLFGCGWEGLTLDRVTRFRFENGRIRECTGGIFSAQHSTELYFVKSTFENNKCWRRGFRLDSCRDVTLEHSTISRNSGDGALFDTDAKITVRNSTIKDNTLGSLADMKAVQFDSVTLSNNVFSEK